MTAEEKAEIGVKLEASRATLGLAVARLSEAQWHFVPATGGWSIAQIVEHVAHIEWSIIDSLRAKIQTEPPDSAMPEATDRKEVLLLRGVPNRSRKAEMPSEFDFPQGTGEGTALFRQFNQARDRSLEFVRNCTVDLRQYGNEHFVFKMLNGEQWLLLIALHAERHAAQIAEIKLSPDYVS